MHLLHSQAIGMEVIDEAEHHIVGKVAELLFDPDRGTLVALLIRLHFSPTLLALQIQDIAAWGTRVHIREQEVLSPPDDLVRLAPYLYDRRRILGQRIETKGGQFLGRCSDLQLHTERFELEWIFPKKFLWKGIPLPASDILEITERAIIVKDQTPKEEKIVAEVEVKQPNLDPVFTPAPGYSVRAP